MATNMPTECSICTEEYNEEERCPRILPCFHTLCSSCILDIIRSGDKKCPFCIQDFERERITYFKINISTLEIVMYIKDLQSKFSQSRNTTGTSPSGEIHIKALKREMSKLNSKNLEACLNAQKKLKAVIDRNNEQKDFFISANRKIREEVIPKVMITFSRNNKQVLHLEKENERLEDQMSVLKGKVQQLEEARKKVDNANTFGSAGSLMDEAKNMDAQLTINCEVLELICENNEKLQQDINKISKVLEKRMSTMMEMVKGCELELENSGDENMDPYIDIETLSIQTAIGDHIAALGETNGKMKQLIEQGMVYARQEHEGKIRHAALSISNNKYLCIHHLQEKAVSPNSVILQFEEAMKMVDHVSRLSFIELKSTTDDKVLGKLMIRLTHDTKRAKNFQLLCTGQEGPSYSDTNILKLLDKGTVKERVWLGDYESRTGIGGKSLVSGAVNEKGGVLRRPCKVGEVGPTYPDDETKLSQFRIFIRDRPGMHSLYSFGYIEGGLQILIDAINRYPEMRKIKISDCGMVLRTL